MPPKPLPRPLTLLCYSLSLLTPLRKPLLHRYKWEQVQHRLGGQQDGEHQGMAHEGTTTRAMMAPAMRTIRAQLHPQTQREGGQVRSKAGRRAKCEQVGLSANKHKLRWAGGWIWECQWWWVVGEQWREQEWQQQHRQQCTLTPTPFFVYFSLSEYAQQQQPHCIPLSLPLLSF